MKRNILVIASLMLAAQVGAFGQINPDSSSAFGPDEKKWIRSEGDLDEAAVSQMSYDAFLTGSGYIVYPVEEDISLLQAKIERNPMILHKDFIPRRVRVLREVAGQGKVFVMVSEIGSASIFMVNKKELHFVESQSDKLNDEK